MVTMEKIDVIGVQHANVCIDDLCGAYVLAGGEGEYTEENVIDQLHEIYGGWQSADSFEYDGSPYYPQDWADLAPYIRGEIDWIGEDGSIWRDEFKNGKMYSYPLKTASEKQLVSYFKLAEMAEKMWGDNKPDIDDAEIAAELWHIACGNAPGALERRLKALFERRGWI